MNSSTLNIAIEVDDKGSVKLRQLGSNAKEAGEKGEKSFKSMRGQVNKLRGDTDLSIASFAKLGGMAFTGTLAGITALTAGSVAMIASAGNQAREMENLSRLAVMNSEDFQKTAYATQQFGIEQDKLADISKDTLEKLGEFTAKGSGGFKDFFDDVAPKIGLTAKELQGLSGPDVLVAVTDAMEKANLSYEEQSFYLESIASDTTALIPLLKDHGAALKEQTDRADELGLAISNVETARLVAAQRATNELTTAVGSLKTHVAASLAPAFTDVTGKILDGMSEGAGGVDNLAVTISEKLLGALGMAVETMRFFHNGWLGIKLVGTGAIDAIAHSIEFLYGGVRTLLAPLDLAMEGLVKLGAIDVNPFDGIEQTLGTFSASSRDVTVDVLSDIDKTNAGYDSVKATIDSYIGSIKESGEEAKIAADKQIEAAKSIDTATRTAEANIQSYKSTTFVSTMSGYSSFQTASKETRDQLVHDQTVIADDHEANTARRKDNESGYSDFARSASSSIVSVFARDEEIKMAVAKLAADTLIGYAQQWATSSIDAILQRHGEEIGANVALGTAQTSTEGSSWTEKIATGAGYLAAAAAAVFAGKAVGDSMYTEGGYIGQNPGGGLVTAGSGFADDVFAGYTDGGATRNWIMGGEYVMDKETTRENYALLEYMRGKKKNVFADGGAIADAWGPTRDINDSGFDTFWDSVIESKGDWWSAVGESIAYYAGTGAGMISGKLVGKNLYRDGGLIADRKFGFGGFISDMLDPGGVFHDQGDTATGMMDIWAGGDPGTNAIFDQVLPWFGGSAGTSYIDQATGMDSTGSVDWGKIWAAARDLPIVGETIQRADKILYPFVRDTITPGLYPDFATVEDTLKGAYEGLGSELATWVAYAGIDPVGGIAGGALLGSYENGTGPGGVPKTGPYLLHEGEDVTSVPQKSEQNDTLLAILVAVRKTAKILERFEYTGIPQSKREAVA